MGSPALSTSLGKCKLDVTRQRLWHKRVLENIKIGAVERSNGTVQAQLRAYHLDVQERMKVRVHSWHTVVSMDLAEFSVDGGAPPVRSENETDFV